MPIQLAGSAIAAVAAPPLDKLGLAHQPVEIPSILHVVGVFVVVAALAIGAAILIKRLAPRFLRDFSGRQFRREINIVARQRLEPGVQAHLLEVTGERVLVVVSRSGLAVHRVTAGQQPSSSEGARS